MKSLRERDFNFLNSPENPYLLGVKLPKVELVDKGWITNGVVRYIREKISTLVDSFSHDNGWNHAHTH